MGGAASEHGRQRSLVRPHRLSDGTAPYFFKRAGQFFIVHDALSTAGYVLRRPPDPNCQEHLTAAVARENAPRTSQLCLAGPEQPRARPRSGQVSASQAGAPGSPHAQTAVCWQCPRLCLQRTVSTHMRIHTRSHAHMHTYAHTCTHTRTHMLSHAHTHAHMFTLTHTYAHACTHTPMLTCARTRTCMPMLTHAHTLTHADMHTHAHMFTHTQHMHTHAHMHLHTPIHGHMHTHAHAHTHAQTCTHTCSQTCMHTHAHMHMLTHAHAPTRSHMHTHTHAHTYMHAHTYPTHACTHTCTHTHLCPVVWLSHASLGKASLRCLGTCQRLEPWESLGAELTREQPAETWGAPDRHVSVLEPPSEPRRARPCSAPTSAND